MIAHRLLGFAYSVVEDMDAMWGRRLESMDNDKSCEPFDDVDPWMSCLYLIITVYLFSALGIVCDEWFVPSLEKISEVLQLSSDVAGATFMAAGSSAPELFVSVADTFGPSHGSGYGIGTIVGSAMFNILVIVAMSAACCSEEIVIDWKPVVRDCFFYSVAILVMIIIISDSVVTWYEGLIMVIMYGCYILFMVFNKKLFDQMENCKTKLAGRTQDQDELDEATSPTVEMNPVIKSEMGSDQEENGHSSTQDKETEEEEDEADPNNYWHRFEFPEEGVLDQTYYILTLPAVVAFTLTIPDCSKTVCEKYYVPTFILSIIWIMILCMFMVQCAAAVGCLLDISPVIMGIVVLSVGTSIPDALGSVAVAKKGEADMAISNAVGSNVFDILLGLGVPWTLYTIFSGKSVTMSHQCSIAVPIAILFGTLIFFFGVLVANKWKMNNRLGVIFLAFYFVYLTFQLLVGFNVIVIGGEDCD